MQPGVAMPSTSGTMQATPMPATPSAPVTPETSPTPVENAPTTEPAPAPALPADDMAAPDGMGTQTPVDDSMPPADDGMMDDGMPPVEDDMPPVDDMPEEQLSEAMTLYVALCAECHGDFGQGVEGQGPEIQHPVREFGEHLVRNGRDNPEYMEPMPALAADALSDEILNEIWDFLDEQPRPTDGPGLYADFCQNCHAADGNAIPNHSITGDRATAEHFIENVRGGHHAGEFDNATGYMPAMSADFISDQEITMIAEFVATF